MRVVTVASQRSNVGKTTTVASLAQGLSQRGHRVLAIDLDPQGELSQAFGVDADRDGLPSSQDLLDGKGPAQVIVPTSLGDIVPASIDLACADMRYLSLQSEVLLADALAQLEDSYDFAVIDTPPNLGILTVNALVASSGVVVLVAPDTFKAKAVQVLMDVVKNVRRIFNPSLRVYGTIVGRYDARVEGAAELLADVVKQVEPLAGPVFKTVVREGATLKGATDAADAGKLPRDYRDLADELLKVMADHGHA